MPAVIRVITEVDLNAYIDDELSETDRSAVEVLLQDDEDALQLVLSRLRHKRLLMKALSAPTALPEGKQEALDRSIAMLADKLEARGAEPQPERPIEPPGSGVRKEGD